MFQDIGRQIIFFLLSLLIVIKYLIFGNNEIEKDEDENESKTEILELKKKLEGMSNKMGGMSNTIGGMSNKIEEMSNKMKEISNENENLKDKIALLIFEQNFMVNYHNDINQKSKLKKKAIILESIIYYYHFQVKLKMLLPLQE